MKHLQIITAKEWQQMPGKEHIVLVDIRSPEDYRRQHIPGAVSIPYEQLQKAAPLRHKRLVLYCEKGVTSTAAGLMLADRGYTVAMLKGGIEAYYKKKK